MNKSQLNYSLLIFATGIPMVLYIGARARYPCKLEETLNGEPDKYRNKWGLIFFKRQKPIILTVDDRMKGTSVRRKYLSKISTDKGRRIFRRFWEEIPKIGEIELKPFYSYPSFYAGRRLVGVQPLKDQVKLHLTMEDAKHADLLEDLRGATRPHKGREEWVFIYITKEQQVGPALSVIKKAYCKRKL